MGNFTQMLNKYFNNGFRERIQDQAEKFGVKGKQAFDIISLASGTVKEILQAELKNGNYNGVVTFLKSAPVQAGTNLVADKIIQRLVGRLILRFGLPGGVALNVATLLVPFIIKRLSKKALKSGKVQDLLNSVGVTSQLEKLNILKNQVKDKFSPGQAA
ncbi:hypothetical protein AAE02nite_43160 [Adhaeribacter aerolatus]|uniref:DUF937 domain-containing protein n=1 Tax=Adhaeribacter aerolatus TaxID=670289 RepID=A0A512B3X5_9BACT|nr:hypothetical protein [Adhaeribacter aerolatus]GEO06652.1 hypothetical protein AAE02nite_43160 [Adhaeribacter aerolatus]